MYLQWNCKKHGFYKYKEKYRPRCKQCFLELKKELEEYKIKFNKINSKLINITYKFEKLKRVRGKEIIENFLND